MSSEVKEYLTRVEAAKYVRDQGIPFSDKTLQKYATVGGGPKYYKFGNRAIYMREHLNEWIRQKLGIPAASTSEREVREAEGE